jgi:hypothetical protein
LSTVNRGNPLHGKKKGQRRTWTFARGIAFCSMSTMAAALEKCSHLEIGRGQQRRRIKMSAIFLKVDFVDP